MGNNAHVLGMFTLPAVSAFSVCSNYPEYHDTLVRPKLPWTLLLLGGVEPTTPSRCTQVLCVQGWRNFAVALNLKSG